MQAISVACHSHSDKTSIPNIALDIRYVSDNFNVTGNTLRFNHWPIWRKIPPIWPITRRSYCLWYQMTICHDDTCDNCVHWVFVYFSRFVIKVTQSLWMSRLWSGRHQLKMTAPWASKRISRDWNTFLINIFCLDTDGVIKWINVMLKEFICVALTDTFL